MISGVLNEIPVPASAGRRILSSVMDVLIVWIIFSQGYNIYYLMIKKEPFLRSSGATSHEMMIYYGFMFLYFLVFHQLFGKTIGKMITKTRVVSIRQKKPAFLEQLIRTTGYAVSALPLGLGFILMVFRKDRRALHDLMSGTYVMRER